MASDMDSSLTVDYPSLVTSTNTQVSRVKTSLVNKYTRSAQENEPEKDQKGRIIFYCTICSYGNSVTTNIRNYLEKSYNSIIGKRVNYGKDIVANQLINLQNSVIENYIIDKIKSLVLKKILNKDVS